MTKDQILRVKVALFNQHCGYNKGEKNFVDVDSYRPGRVRLYHITTNDGRTAISGLLRLTVAEAIHFVNGMMAARELYD